MTREPTVRRGGPGPLGGVLAVAVLGLVELAIIGVLIVLPIMGGEELALWRIVLAAGLLTVSSVAFMAVSFVRDRGKWRWRWAR